MLFRSWRKRRTSARPRSFIDAFWQRLHSFQCRHSDISPGLGASGPLVALDQHIPENSRSVGHEPVHTQVEESVHLIRIIDGPDMDL